MLKVGSDFSGVGAFEVALKRLGVDHQVVYACDIDKYARDTYLANNPAPPYYPHDVYDRKIPKDPLDIYMTSPPCQAFSIAGYRKGEKEERGVLFYNSHEFIIKNRPRFFIFENVKGLLSDDEGRTFQRWLDYLAQSINGNPMLFPHEKSAGYHVYWSVLNSKSFGVPQNRERVFIVGIRDDQDNVFNFPKGFPLTTRLKDILEEDVDERYFLSQAAITKCLKSSANANMLNEGLPNESRTIISGYHKIPFDGQYVSLDSPTRLFGIFDKDGERHQAGSVFDKEGISPTLDTAQGGWRQPMIVPERLYANKRIRKLTPRECFRLQDFPDSFKLVGSDTQKYRQAGNSITCSVLYNLLNQLKL